MHLRLNRKSPLPLHVQLKAQLAHLIQVGQWRSGARLPTVRELAALLRINRNTAARVFAELGREGLLSSERGRGTFVSPRPGGVQPARTRELVLVVDEAMARARGLGWSPVAFSAALYARAHAAEGAWGPRVPVVFVECNAPQLHRFSRQLAEALPVKVEPLLIGQVERVLARRAGAAGRPALVATTLFHVRRLRRLLAGGGWEVAGLPTVPALETLTRLAALPDGARVGVACLDSSGAGSIRLAIRSAGLGHLRLVPACAATPSSLRRMLRDVRAVVCSSLVAGRLRALAPRRVEVLVDDRRLDRQGIEMLRRRLAAAARD